MKQKAIYYFFRCSFILLTVISSNGMAQAQVSPADFDYPYNHLSWYTLEGEHFMVHYQEGNDRAAQVVSLIAHKVYEPVTELYRFEPERKVSIILRDREDYSNGAAYFFDDKIEIWLPAIDTPLRGTHQWLRNVVTHEFTHIVQMGASMKRNSKIPAVYLQWLSYEDIRRPDVLYGSPNGIVSLPFSTVSIPAWFSEGTAQYQREDIFHDFWDSHRDMILRMAILNDNFHEFHEMGDFSSKNSLERELVYNQGFDFIRYLTDRYGEQVIRELTRASAEGVNNFDKVMQIVTGLSGRQNFDDWILNRKKMYADQIKKIDPYRIVSVKQEGFMNFYPQYNPQGDTFGYLTNRGKDYATTQLVLQSAGSSITIGELNHINSTHPGQPDNQHAHSGSTIDYVGNRFSFSPDGKKVAYSKSRKNRYGEQYKDIYIFDTETDESKKITTDARVQDPAWHPAGNKITAIQLDSGTQNLILINLHTGNHSQVTAFGNGETIYTPVWAPDGNNIYFSTASTGNRNLYKLDAESGELNPILQNDRIDFRDPWIDPEGRFLFFSSDADGIFNIYRKKIGENSIQKITAVQGGAFMPFALKDSLYFSEYKSDGYKISAIALPGFEVTHHSEDFSVPAEQKTRYTSVSRSLSVKNFFDELKQLTESPDSSSTTNVEKRFTVSSYSDSLSYTWRPYHQVTTGLSIIPVVRFDNYSKLEGSNSRLIKSGKFGKLGKNLVRDFKAGAYFSSREVTERLNIFAGALFGWGSIGADNLSGFFSPNRLNNLDRDLFFIVDYRGIPFIKRSWSPTVSIEIYNMKRNVQDGLAIEEFPCTSCFPVQKSVDIRYHVWEANLFLRSKLNRWSLLELGASYSPYSVATDGFFSEEFKEYISGSTTEYFKGSSYSLSYIADAIAPARHSDIAPEGIWSSASFRVENGRLLQEFEIDDGTLSPRYSKKTNYSFEWKNRMGHSFSDKSTLMLTTRGFTYFNNPEDYFYLDYAGGLSGMRSYPYFAIGGQRTFWSRFSLLTPLVKNINKQAGAYKLDKIYAHLFFEAGNGWGGPLNIGNNIKTGIGTELRITLNNFYLFPLKLFANTTYGLNRFNVTLPEQFISTSSDRSIGYGREFLFYFGITFDFNQL